MKRYLLILTSVLVFLVIGVSAVFASIALPPANPTTNPPGPLLSQDQIIAAQAVKRCEEQLRSRLDDCPGRTQTTLFCREDALKAYHECLRGVHAFLNPPQILLPNGGSPGQDN